MNSLLARKARGSQLSRGQSADSAHICQAPPTDASPASPPLVCTSASPVPLWEILTWIRRKLFVSQMCRQPLVDGNVL